jgi:transcriptional regulator with XRE-family HTH domain
MPTSEPNRIKDIRKAKGLTMEALAQACGTTAPQIDKLEKGRVRLNLDWMRRIATALGCHWAELVEDGPAAINQDLNVELLAQAIIVATEISDELRAAGHDLAHDFPAKVAAGIYHEIIEGKPADRETAFREATIVAIAERRM